MSVIVNTNVPSMIAQRHLNNATKALNTATERLSTGIKINRAGDDPAGLFIAKGLETQLSGSEQCQTNIALALNVLEIAEGDLATISDNIERIKDLATQAATDLYSQASRDAMQLEIDGRIAEITRIAKSSSFNGFNLLDGNVFISSGLRIQVGHGSNAATNAVIIQNVFVDSTADAIGMTPGWISVSTAAAAAQTIQYCSNSLDLVTKRRTNIGVTQSRLQMTAEGLETSIEHLASTKSTIMDTDVGKETAEMTKQQILQQISTSVLTQANQAAGIALSLLQ